MFASKIASVFSTVSVAALLAAGCASESTDPNDPDGEGGRATTSTATGWTTTTTTTTTGGTGAQGGSGGGSAAIDCDAAPCGGDVSGAWAYTAECSLPPWNVDASCPDTDETRRSRYIFYPQGTVTFDEDGTSTITKSIVAGWEFIIPKACLVFSTECAGAVQGDGVVCVEEGTDCLCNSIAEGPVETATEPYEVNGTTIIAGSGAEAATLDYCVKGASLKLVHPESGEATFLTRP